MFFFAIILWSISLISIIFWFFENHVTIIIHVLLFFSGLFHMEAVASRHVRVFFSNSISSSSLSTDSVFSLISIFFHSCLCLLYSWSLINFFFTRGIFRIFFLPKNPKKRGFLLTNRISHVILLAFYWLIVSHIFVPLDTNHMKRRHF